MKLKQLAFIFYFCFISVFSKAQVNVSFIDYLSKNNLKREHFAYLNNLSNQLPADTLSYFKAKYYLQYFNDSLFNINYLNCKKIFINDTTAFNKANILFLKPDITNQNKWFSSFDAEKNISFVSKNIRYVYTSSISPLDVNVFNLPVPIQKDFLNYKKMYNKKPVIGGVLSTVVPGLGKLYVNKNRSFVTTFFTHAIFAAQSYESIHKLGVKNPFSIFSISIFSIFYIANIYGSYHDVIQVKKDTKKQYLINAFNYYNFNYSY